MIKELPSFIEVPEIDQKELIEIFQRGEIREIRHFVLGPPGTNIDQAARKWTKENNLFHRSKFVYCETPEKEIEEAKKIKDDKVFPVFWTCAVYYKLYKVFFENPDIASFLIVYSMRLNRMQFCTREEKAKEIKNGIPSHWKIAAHQSPAPLLNSLKCKVLLTTSNSKAAEICAQGRVDACITTEKARQLYGLVKIHEFGSPMMVFFAGTTRHGIEILKKLKVF